MTAVSNTNGTGSVSYLTDFSTDPAGAALTPDALLAFCQNRLGSLDDNINQYMTKQQEMNGVQKQWSNLLEVTWGKDGKTYGSLALQQLTPNSQPAREYVADMANKFLEVYKNSTDPGVKEAAAEEFRLATGLEAQTFVNEGRAVTPNDIALSANANKIGGCDAAATTARMDGYKNKLADISRNAELDMIKLQSLVSQRQLAVQLTTQMIQKLGEMTLAPIQKI